MTSDRVRDVKAFIVSCLREQLSAAGFDGQPIPDGFDLRLRGLIDSLGFIQLIVALEDRFGGPIDLADVPPEDLTNIDVLSRHVAAHLLTRHVS